jgi:flagellar protein FlaF
MAVTAYQKAQRAADNPRSAEYRLFGQVTGALMDVQNVGSRGPVLVDAIDWNRRVWSTLAVDCLDNENQLPRELRAQIVSLSLWVTRYSSEVVQQGASLDPLIDVNRSIMQGLRGAA